MAEAVPTTYRGRFAPTPSGPLHFGSLVAAAGSYLEARSRSGEWCLRIDDLDPPRVAPGATDLILRCLEAYGLQWDGPVLFQSRRLPAYHAALHQLRRLGVIYPCACTRKQIGALVAASGEDVLYPGTCRDALPPGRPARALRLNVRGAHVALEDRLLGRLSRDLEHSAGDFIVYRFDRIYAFHLASAVDDAEQGMTDVVRGADLLESSMRQALVLRLLALPAPRYVHLPVAVNASGEKLSKQTKAAALDPSRPLPALLGVWRFLNQAWPKDFGDASVPEFWRYAIAHWDLRRVGPRLQARAPD